MGWITGTIKVFIEDLFQRNFSIRQKHLMTTKKRESIRLVLFIKSEYSCIELSFDLQEIDISIIKLLRYIEMKYFETKYSATELYLIILMELEGYNNWGK